MDVPHGAEPSRVLSDGIQFDEKGQLKNAARNIFTKKSSTRRPNPTRLATVWRIAMSGMPRLTAVCRATKSMCLQARHRMSASGS